MNLPIKKNLITATIAAVFGLGLSSANAGELIAGTVNGTENSTVVVPISFAGDGATVDFQGDVVFAAGIDFVGVAPANGGGCALQAAPNDDTVRVTAPAGLVDPIPAGPTVFCNITFDIPPGAPEGSVPLTIDDASVICFNIGGTEEVCTGTDGAVNVVGIEGPTVEFTPAPGPLALPGGVQGGTATANVTASTIANPGEAGGADASVDCGVTAGFTIDPNAPVDFISGTGSEQIFEVSCVRPDEGAGDLLGTLTCDVEDQGGSSQAIYDLTCPEGVAIAGPTLSFDPNGGAFPLPGGLIGNMTSRGIAVNVDDPGEAGGPDSVATCTGDAVFTVTGSPVTVEAGSTEGGTITVSCTMTDTEQLGTVTCDIDGGAPVTFDAVCPAGGTFVLPEPTPVPTMSNWGLYTLILVMLGLGAGFAYRRLS